LLRAVAVALVIFDHWGLRYPGTVVGDHAGTAGWLGVDLFLVLSGFLVSGLINDEEDPDWRTTTSRA
jgi:peptidoglycan/LPS O-acetylase OafA/YrhL